MTEKKKTLTLSRIKGRGDSLPKEKTLSLNGKRIFVPKKLKGDNSTDGYCRNDVVNTSASRGKRKLESKNKHKLALRKLEETFPKIFNLANPRPLEKGIREDLLRMNKKVSNKTVRLGLFFYCNSHQYLSSTKEGVQRVNSTGRYTKKVSKEEEIKAQEKLKSLFRSLKSKGR